MIQEVELSRSVSISEKCLDRHGRVSKRLVMTRLLQELLVEKSSKEHGYYLAITNVKSIGKGEVSEPGNASFPVVFQCRTFLPVKGEILEGVVHRIYRMGALLRIGPMKCVFLSNRKMPGYNLVPGEYPYFQNAELARIKVDMVVRFLALDVRCSQSRRGDHLYWDFHMLASLEPEDGDPNSLGPVSLSGSDD